MFCYEKNRTSVLYRKIEVQRVKRLSTKKLMKKIINYGVPITICVGMTYAGNLVDVWNTKVRLMAGGLSDVNSTILYGYLTKYQQLMNVPITIISSLSAAILPAISAAFAVKNNKRVRDNINYSFRLCFLIAIPCAVGFSVLSDPIFKLLKFRGGSYIMAWGSVVLVLMSLMQIQTTILQSIGKLYTATLYSILGICIKITTNYFLIAVPEINILGAVVGSTVGFAVPIILNHRIIKRSLNVKIEMIGHAVKPLAASVTMGIIVYVNYVLVHFILGFIKIAYILNAISTVSSVAVGVITYMYILALIGGINKKDLQSLPYRVRKLIPGFILAKVK
jgi:stage V sporulation protein B